MKKEINAATLKKHIDELSKEIGRTNLPHERGAKAALKIVRYVIVTMQKS